MSKLAYVFPGQGSQTVGMLSELAEKYPLIRETFDRVSYRLGYDLWQLVTLGPVEKLNQTIYTQVAMLTADVVVFQLLKHLNFKQAAIMAGHSLGEYAALVCAEALSLEDGAVLVAKRAELMQAYVPIGQGAMAAIVGLSDEEVAKLCVLASQDEQQVSPANFNAIGQVVIAGHTPAVERAVVLAEQFEARMAKMIPVSVPCHCALLIPAAEEFSDYLANTKISTPNTAVISNVDLGIYQSPQQIKSLLKEQLYRPVRWVETIQLMQKMPIEFIIECGPGKVLSGLIKRIDKTLITAGAYDNDSLQQALALFN